MYWVSPVDFRDEARLRLGLPLLNTLSHCDGCNKPWSVSHALSCPFGGLVTVRHNEARDEIMETCCAAYAPSRVRDEPRINIVRATGGCKSQSAPAPVQKGKPKGRAVPAVSVVEKLSRGQRRRRNRQQAKAAGAGEEEAGAKDPSPAPEPPRRRNALDGDGEEKEEAVCAPSEDNRRADLLVRGCWSPNMDCLLDFVVTDVNQLSYRSRKPKAVLRSHEQRKKKKYLEDCLAQRRDFTPFAVSCEGMLGREADCFIKRIAMKLARKWSRPYSQVVSFAKTRFAISLVRAKNRCLRGSRIRPEAMSFRVQFDDGAGLGLYSTLE